MTQDDTKGRPEIIEYLKSPQFRDKVRGANLIYGINEYDQPFIVYGLAALHKCARNGVPFEASVLKQPIIVSSDELEALLAVVLVEKGSYDYNGVTENISSLLGCIPDGNASRREN